LEETVLDIKSRPEARFGDVEHDEGGKNGHQEQSGIHGTRLSFDPLATANQLVTEENHASYVNYQADCQNAGRNERLLYHH